MASFELDDDDENDGVVPQRRVQVSQEQEDLVVKGEEDVLWPSSGIPGYDGFFSFPGHSWYDFEPMLIVDTVRYP